VHSVLQLVLHLEAHGLFGERCGSWCLRSGERVFMRSRDRGGKTAEKRQVLAPYW
jgi:hypothetical protein